MKQSRLSARLSYNRGSVVAANVVKSAQSAVVAAHYNHRLAGHRCGNEVTGRFYLLGARHQLPGFAEYIEAFEFGDAGIEIPRCGNRGGLRKWRVVVVTQQNLLDRSWHGRSSLGAD